MPKDNEVDEKVTKGIVATVCLVPHLSDHFAGVEMQLFGNYEPRIGDEFYSAATVAELRAEVERLRGINSSLVDKCNRLNLSGAQSDQRADAAERRVGELEKLMAAARRAIGDHHAPNDCYATGPLTGDAFLDIVQCPACAFLEQHEALTGADPT